MVVIITTTIVRGNWITLRGTRRMPRAGDGYGWHGYSLRDGGHRTDGRRPLETPSIFPLFRGRSTASFDSISGGGGSLAAKAVLAIGVPFGFVSVVLAVLAGNVGVTLLVAGNAMRLSRVTPDWENGDV